MANLGVSRATRTFLVLGSVALSALGCGADPANGVLRVGSRNLRCPAADLETALHRESSRTREYYVGCDFMFTRVLCDKPTEGGQAEQCHPAKPQPPCFGGGCFKENPITFEWELDETMAQADPTADASVLFEAPK